MGLISMLMGSEESVWPTEDAVADVPAEESGVADSAPVVEGESTEEAVAPVADSVALSGGSAPILDTGVNITA
jgi:hypothetical protein